MSIPLAFRRISMLGIRWYKVAAPALVPIALFVGGIFRPVVEQTVLRTVFSERAQLFISIDRPAVRVGEDLGLKVWIVPNGRLPLSRGLLRLSFDRRGVDTREPIDFGFGGTDKPTSCPENSLLRLTGQSPGRYPVTAVLKTERQTYQVTTDIVILPSATPGGPSTQNFSGAWEFRLGVVRGTMALVQDGTSVAGSYRLENNTSGSFSGIRDGYAFKVDFFRGSPTRKWVIDGEWKTNAGFLEIVGTARPVRFNGADYISDGTATPFYAAARGY